MGSQMIIRIDDETKKKFYKFARMEGKTASEKVREMVEGYIERTDIGPAIDNLWERIGRKIREKGFTRADIDKTIRKVRTSR
jgi:predicted DNA-binding protein